MADDTITIEVSRNLAKHFLTLAGQAVDQMGAAGCNDFEIDDTPENRELAELIDAANARMSLEEYRKSDEYDPPVAQDGKVFVMDYPVFQLFVEKVGEALIKKEGEH